MQSPHFKLLRLCRDAINGSLKPDLVAAQLKELTQQNTDVPSLLLDVLQVVDAEAEVGDATGSGRKRLEALVTLVSGSLIPDDVLKLELDAVGASETSTKSRLVKTKTRLFYKQLKFNLLREESEGYAKLLTELTDFNDNLGATIALGRVRCLIGQFNLDPNRVLDIILECFECSPERSSFFCALLKEFRASKDDVCHILGFKFTFYHNKTDSRTPDSLYKVAGLLCHENLLDLHSLCSYLTPKLDDLMNDHKMRIDEAGKRAKKAEVVSSAAVAESSATGDPPPPSGTAFAVVTANQDADAADDDTDTLAANQKLGLTCALLEIGDWLLAKQLLDRLPEYYAVNSSRRIATAIIDMIGAAIETLYRDKCQDQQVCTDLPRRSNSKRRLNIGQGVAAFPLATSWKDLADDLLPVLGYLGPNLAYRPLIMTKLIRLVSAFFMDKVVVEKNCLKDGSDGCIADPDLAEFDRISPLLIDLCDEVLVPSLTMADGNSALADELWLLLSQFPYTLRYRFYGRWKNIHTLRHPGLLLRRGRVVGKTRYVVKRLSKETTKIIGRQIGKLSHTHPAVVFDYLLNQIQTFENLIGPVVESVRFLTFLEFDVLSYCIIEHLASPDKQQLKASDGTLSPWLQSLATFVGTAFKKYNMELTGVLQYVANQLKNGKSFDLLVLREVIQNMSGIETTSALTIEQLEALAGGDVLRQEGGSFGQVKNVRRATNRLREALFQEDLVVGLCILTAQQRGCIIFKESESFPLKLTGQMLDQCQDTLVQFGYFLSTNLRPDDYSKRMPSAPDLMSQYYLAPDAAMFLARPIFINAVNAKYDKTKNADKDRDDKGRLSIERKNIMYHAAFSSLARELADKLKAVLPDSMWMDLSPSLFVTFWSLTMYDLNVPVASYDREIDKVKKAIQTVQDNAEGLSKTKRTKEEERLKNLESRLSDEKRRQMEHVDRIKHMFRTDREGYFASTGARVNQITQFLQTCILPRATFTDMDAVYCAKFIELLHSQRTHFFPTAVFLDKLFFDIGSLLAGLSENEANFFGRFLSALIEHVMRWHSDKAVYDKECFGFPGFFSKMRRPNTTVDTTLPDDAVPYDGYRSLCFKWHRCLTRSFIAILGSSSYVLVRNGLQVLLKLLSSYPIISGHVLAIEKRVVTVRDQEKGKRDDLSLMAASYAGHLKMRKSKVLEESDFHTMQKPPPKKPPPKPAATVAPVKAAAPAVKAATTKSVVDGTKSAAVPEQKLVVKTEPPPSPTVSSAAGASHDKRKRPATDATDSSSVEKRRKDDGSSSVSGPKKALPALKEISKSSAKDIKEDGEITEPTTPVAKSSAVSVNRKVVKTVKAEPSSPTIGVDREKDSKAKDKLTTEKTSSSSSLSSSNESKKERPKDSSAVKSSPKTSSGHRAIVAPSPEKRTSSKESEKREKEKVVKPSAKDTTPASDRSDGSGSKRSKRSAENGSSSSAAPVKKSKSTSKEKERDKATASSLGGSKSKETSVNDKRVESDSKASGRERERSSDSRKVRK